MSDAKNEPMTKKRLAEIQTRLANWRRGYWLAGQRNASLMQNIDNADTAHEICAISAEHGDTIEFLTHAYADMHAILADNERLRAENARANDLIESVGVGEMELVARITALENENATMRAIVQVVADAGILSYDLIMLTPPPTAWTVRGQARALLATPVATQLAAQAADTGESEATNGK